MTDTAKLLHHLRARLNHTHGRPDDDPLMSYYAHVKFSLTIGEVRRAVEEIEQMQSEPASFKAECEALNAVQDELATECTAREKAEQQLAASEASKQWKIVSGIDGPAMVDRERQELKDQLTAATQRAEAAERECERLTQRLLTAAGDDLCRLTQEEIGAMSAGGVKIPPKEEFLASCERFHAQVAKEAGVLGNCLTLAQLVAENAKLEQQVAVGTRELRCYVEGAGFTWCEEETTVFNVTTAMAWLNGAFQSEQAARKASESAHNRDRLEWSKQIAAATQRAETAEKECERLKTEYHQEDSTIRAALSEALNWNREGFRTTTAAQGARDLIKNLQTRLAAVTAERDEAISDEWDRTSAWVRMAAEHRDKRERSEGERDAALAELTALRAARPGASSPPEYELGFPTEFAARVAKVYRDDAEQAGKPEPPPAATTPTGQPIAIYDGKLTLTVERTDDGMVRLSFGGGFGHPATWELTPEQAGALRRELPGADDAQAPAGEIPRLTPKQCDEIAGRVRLELVRWAIEQPSPPGRWLISYPELGESEKYAYRQIGQALYYEFMVNWLPTMREPARPVGESEQDRTDRLALPTCMFCDNVAVCYARSSEHEGFACDECCGHGDEDQCHWWLSELRPVVKQPGVPVEVCEPIAEYLAADPHWIPPVVRLENDKAKVTQQQCLDFIAAVEAAIIACSAAERTYTYREYQERFSRQATEESDDPREVGRAMAREIISGLDVEAATSPGERRRYTEAEQAALDGALAVLAQRPSVPPTPTSPDEWQEACHEWRDKCERLAGMLVEVAESHGWRIIGEHLGPPEGHPANGWAAEWCKVRHDEGDMFIPGYLPRVIAEDLERLNGETERDQLRAEFDSVKAEIGSLTTVAERLRAGRAAEAELARIREALAGIGGLSQDEWLSNHGWENAGGGYWKKGTAVCSIRYAIAREAAEIVAPREQTTPESPADQRREAMKEFSAAVNANPDMTADQLRRMAAIALEGDCGKRVNVIRI